MSLTPLFADGFEQYTSATTAGAPAVSLWDAISGSVGTNFGRFGGVGIAINASALQKSLPSSLSVGGVAFAVTPNTASAIAILTLYDSAGTVQGVVQRNADGSVSVYRGNAATLLGTSAGGVLPQSVTNHVEAQCKVDPSAGTWDVWVNGVSVLSLSGLNTRGSAVVGSGVARFGHLGNISTAYSYDDVIAYDATSRTGATGGTFEHYGDKRVQTLFPSGAGTGDVNPGNWTQVGGTGGSPWTAVNERPQNGDTSYLADATVSDIKSFALDDLAAGTTGVVAVFPTVCLEKDDATSRQVAAGLRTSSTNAFTTAQGTPSTYAYQQSVMTTDGAGAALTPTGVNGSELLVKIAA